MQLEVKLNATLPDDMDAMNVAMNCFHVFAMLKEYEKLLNETHYIHDEVGQQFLTLFRAYL